MSRTELSPVATGDVKGQKRKRDVQQDELEINLNAPEPPSKKALRRAKKDKSSENVTKTEPDNWQSRDVPGNEDAVPNRGKRSEFGIWIGNLSFTTTKSDLLTFLTSDLDHSISNDEITRIHLPSGKANNGKSQNKGFAYVDFADANALARALELSEKLFGGRRILIKDATNFEGRPSVDKDKPGSTGRPPSRRVFIGNLGFDTGVDDLEKHFGVCGPIRHTHMATFEDSGKCKGFCWMEFEQLSSAQAAMRGWIEEGQMQGDTGPQRSTRRIWLHKIQGRKLRLEYAEDPTTRYNKRFGKKPGVDVESGDVQVDDGDQEVRSASREARTTERTKHRSDSRKRTEVVSRDGYAEDVVQRLQGAIVEGQGKKVVFE